jgi:lactate dehydrogenase-like 2-hydroxyacid dehydrogenase
MNQEIIVVGAVRPVLVDALKAQYRVHDLTGGADRALALAAAARAAAAVTSGAAGIDAQTVAALPALKLVASFGVGIDKVDRAALAARAIALTNTPGATDHCVADHAIGLMLAVARRIAAGDRFVRSGAWLKQRYGLMHRVTGGKLGVLGLGSIGAQVAKRAAGFDMPVGYHNRRRRPDVPHRYFDSPVELARWADVLVVACPGGAETRHIVNAAVLEALGPAGMVVNIARGSVIDEAALAAALGLGAIAGAGLDVFETEPCHPIALAGFDNVVLTPHIAGSTEETWADCEAMVLENLRRFFAGEALLSPVG